MKKIEAYSEDGKLLGTYEIPNIDNMKTETKTFRAFTSEEHREKAWTPTESRLGDYDIVGIHLKLAGAMLVETRLYCLKGKYTYTEKTAADSSPVSISPIDVENKNSETESS